LKTQEKLTPLLPQLQQQHLQHKQTTPQHRLLTRNQLQLLPLPN
jgi:hypothetical protein